MVLAHRLDLRAPVVNGVVAVARTSAVDGDNAKIAAPHEHLRVAGPAVVLGFACGGVITGWHERSVDDPREASIRRNGSWQQRCQTWNEVGGELAKPEVGTQCGADDHETSME